MFLTLNTLSRSTPFYFNYTRYDSNYYSCSQTALKYLLTLAKVLSEIKVLDFAFSSCI